jgi:hypothetical protein
MTRTSWWLGLLVVVMAVGGLSGCANGDRSGRAPYGVYGTVLPNEAPLPSALSGYRSVRFMTAETELHGRRCPPLVVNTYDRWARSPLDVPAVFAAAFPGGPPTLTVESELVYFNKDPKLGPAQLVAHVKIYDGRRLLDKVVVNAVSNSFREGISEELAREAVDAIRRYLAGGQG